EQALWILSGPLEDLRAAQAVRGLPPALAGTLLRFSRRARVATHGCRTALCGSKPVVLCLGVRKSELGGRFCRTGGPQRPVRGRTVWSAVGVGRIRPNPVVAAGK